MLRQQGAAHSPSPSLLAAEHGGILRQSRPGHSEEAHAGNSGSARPCTVGQREACRSPAGRTQAGLGHLRFRPRPAAPAVGAWAKAFSSPQLRSLWTMPLPTQAGSPQGPVRGTGEEASLDVQGRELGGSDSDRRGPKGTATALLQGRRRQSGPGPRSRNRPELRSMTQGDISDSARLSSGRAASEPASPLSQEKCPGQEWGTAFLPRSCWG